MGKKILDQQKCLSEEENNKFLYVYLKHVDMGESIDARFRGGRN